MLHNAQEQPYIPSVFVRALTIWLCRLSTRGSVGRPGIAWWRDPRHRSTAQLAEPLRRLRSVPRRSDACPGRSGATSTRERRHRGHHPCSPPPPARCAPQPSNSTRCSGNGAHSDCCHRRARDLLGRLQHQPRSRVGRVGVRTVSSRMERQTTRTRCSSCSILSVSRKDQQRCRAHGPRICWTMK